MQRKSVSVQRYYNRHFGATTIWIQKLKQLRRELRSVWFAEDISADIDTIQFNEWNKQNLRGNRNQERSHKIDDKLDGQIN